MNFFQDVFFSECLRTFHGLFWKVICVRILWSWSWVLHEDLPLWRQATASVKRASSPTAHAAQAGRFRLRVTYSQSRGVCFPTPSSQRTQASLLPVLFCVSALAVELEPSWSFLFRCPPGTDLSFIFCPQNATQKQQKLPLRRVRSHCLGKSALWCSFICQDCCFHCLQWKAAPLTSGQLGNECMSVSKGDLFSADWVCSGSVTFIQRILSTMLLQKGVLRPPMLTWRGV